MVQKKRPPVMNWNPYQAGETRNMIMNEINLLVNKKDHRRKLGLETGSLREFKGNAHWNLFIAIELAELLNKRLNSDLKNLFIQTTQGMNSTTTHLTNISQQLKKAEYNLGNVTTLASNNSIKIIGTEVAKLNKQISNITQIQNTIKTTTDKIQTEIDNVSNIIQETITQNHQTLLKELGDRNEAMQMIITEDLHSLKKITEEKTKQLNDMAQDNFSDLNEQISEVDNKNTKYLKELSEQVKNTDKKIVSTQEQITSFQEASNNMFDDQQNTIISEIQEGIGGLMKQNLDNFKKLEKIETTQTANVTSRIDETTENLTSIIEATNEHLDKINEHVKDSIVNSESEIKKELNTEVSDIRAILSTIRSDIELMKSVLTKIDTKVH